jgi:sec-independent protein translocase protein TatB
MSFADTVVLFVLALLLFGPKKLPLIARQIGKALNEFRRASNEFKAQIEAEISQLEYQERQKKEQEPKILPPPSDSIPSSPSTRLQSPEDTGQSQSRPPQELDAAASNATNA